MSLITKGDFSEILNLAYTLGIGATKEEIDIDVKGAKEVTIQLLNGVYQSDGSILNGSSTNITVNVYANSGIGYTSIPVASMNLGSNSSDMLFVPTGFYLMKVDIINNDVSNVSTISYKIVVKK